MWLCTLYCQRWVFSLYSVGDLGKCSLSWTEWQNSVFMSCKVVIDFMWSPPKGLCHTQFLSSLCIITLFYLAVPYYLPLLIPLQTSPVVERQLLHCTEEKASRDVELANTKRAKLELEESLREYQARCVIAIIRGISMTVCMHMLQHAAIGPLVSVCNLRDQLLSPLYSNCYWRPSVVWNILEYRC